MPIETIGILSPGDMGQAIAAVLNQHGLKTIAALEERSQRTRQLAIAPWMKSLPSSPMKQVSTRHRSI